VQLSLSATSGPISTASFRQQLDYWRRTFENEFELLSISSSNLWQILISAVSSLARHVAACTDLFINEIALHPEHDIDDLRSPFASLRLRTGRVGFEVQRPTLHPGREEALFGCLAAIHECFDSLLSMDVATACTLPTYFFVRTGYAARALPKAAQTYATVKPNLRADLTSTWRILKFEGILWMQSLLTGKSSFREQLNCCTSIWSCSDANQDASPLTSSKLLSMTKEQRKQTHRPEIRN